MYWDVFAVGGVALGRVWAACAQTALQAAERRFGIDRSRLRVRPHLSEGGV